MTAIKKALITGISGQDGSYLAEWLLDKGYAVHGIVRRASLENKEESLWRIRHILDDVTLHAASIESYPAIANVLEQVRPDEIYHLAAQSFVSYLFEEEMSVFNTNFNGTLHVLSAVRKYTPEGRFYYAGSSEMFGLAKESPQTLQTAFHPRSPYGISKVGAFYLTENYRRSHNLFACSGVLYNHESPRRGSEFVTQKIANTVAQIRLGIKKELRLGNLDAKRDWGYAPDYVEAMWLMLQQDTPDDYIIATGQAHTVREFVEAAFGCVDLDWKNYVILDKEFYRPSEELILTGDNSKAREKLHWQPCVPFQEIISEMVSRAMDNYQK